MHCDTRPAVQSFTLLGTVDGELVEASLNHVGLSASEILLVRADLVVRLGESFDAGGRNLAASLTGSPIQTVLTLIRACDRVLQISMDANTRAHNMGPRL